MALRIETFSDVKGGNAFYKAVVHPLAARKIAGLFRSITDEGSVAIYDPLGYLEPFAEIHGLDGLDIKAVFVQDVQAIGKTILGHRAQPVTELVETPVEAVLVAAFDAQRLIDQIRHLVPKTATVFSLDALRLPDAMLTRQRHYLDALNFATNFAFFREGNGRHTRLMTANYWSNYGAKNPGLWCCLFDGDGQVLAEWQEDLPGAEGVIVIDSAEVRERFGLPAFTGQLFLHVTNIAGHDVVKYALDTYGDDDLELSCTHDANSWPSDVYAGLPAPREDEKVVLWAQNSHPVPIPAGSIGLNLMGASEVAWLEREVPAFGSYPLDIATLLPAARWPQQIELRAGKHMVRPRYEVSKANGHTRIAHVNVERVDLTPDPHIPELANLMGKGYILPAPLLPPEQFRTVVLPTPMATTQTTLPIAALVYDAEGKEVATQSFGRLPRSHEEALDLNQLLERQGASLNGKTGNGAWGHVELVYDFSEGGEADGWLHGLFRYEDKASGHSAETSFGAHMFNSVLTYKNEPQSYAGRPPGLSTRLFLRLGPPPLDALCHLIYPASTPWHGTSETTLSLRNRDGEELASRNVAIACGGSLLWRCSEMFTAEERRATGDPAYVLVRDTTCRLFGYHGLVNRKGAFSFDHMFGF